MDKEDLRYFAGSFYLKKGNDKHFEASKQKNVSHSW